MNTNVFYDAALRKASVLLSKKSRIFLLVSRLALKLSKVNWTKVKGTDVKEKLYTLGRLIKAFATGQYKSMPWKTLLILTAVVVYFISPVDLIPDWLIAVGFTDDVGILLSAYAAANEELNHFLSWEKTQVNVIE